MHSQRRPGMESEWHSNWDPEQDRNGTLIALEMDGGWIPNGFTNGIGRLPWTESKMDSQWHPEHALQCTWKRLPDGIQNCIGVELHRDSVME